MAAADVGAKRAPWPPLTAREGPGAWAAAFSALALLLIASPFDEAWVVALAAYPEPNQLALIGRSLLRGQAPGLLDAVYVPCLLAAVGYLASFLRPLRGIPLNIRARLGALLIVAAGATLAQQALRFALGRPRPLEVLGGAFPYSAWYQLGALPWRETFALADYPSHYVASAAVLYALLCSLSQKGLRRPGPWLVAPSLALVGLVGFWGVYVQRIWPTDAVAGAGVGYAAAWLGLRLQLAPGAGGGGWRWERHPTVRGGWTLRLLLQMVLLALAFGAAGGGIRLAFYGGGWPALLLGLGGAAGTALLLRLAPALLRAAP
ncbi:MAG: phosphatase PAP2 family protein [Candidatus Lambdaproteobacteria bacterium]|nr:phosphatase PAP2 family protein [Candidatus Lambdaproteobacteria bacterium]